MSGKSATQGFIYQTLVAIIDCLERDDWDAIKMEPGTDADKVDYELCKDGNVIHKVQVKSTQSKYSQRQVDCWVRTLEGTKSEGKIHLYLISDDISRLHVKDGRNVAVKTFPFSKLQSECLTALSEYCTRKNIGANIALSDIKFLNDSLFEKIHVNGIESKPVSRAEFEAVFERVVKEKVRVIRFRRAMLGGLIVLAAMLILVAVAMCIHFQESRETRRQVAQNTEAIAALEDRLALAALESDGFTPLYQTARELYATGEYGAAAKKFEKAIREQKLMTGYESRETAALSLDMGLAYLYGGDTAENDGANAISALMEAGIISERTGDSWGALYADYGLASAYYELSKDNKASDICRKALTEADRILENSDKTAVLATYDAEPGVSPDIRDVYACCRAFALRGGLYDLLGKISSRTDGLEETFNCFFYALDAMSDNFKCSAVLVGMADEASAAGNEDIQEYLQEIGGDDFISRKTWVSSYYLEDGQQVVTLETDMPIKRGRAEATTLANRAQFAVALGMYEKAEEDCRKAIDIWEGFDFAQRINISYAYRSLITARLGQLIASGDEALLKNELPELMSYADLAMTYDSELIGVEHWRTALSYESRAFLYILAGDMEAAISDYDKAYEINAAWLDESRAEFDLEEIERLRGLSTRLDL